LIATVFQEVYIVVSNHQHLLQQHTSRNNPTRILLGKRSYSQNLFRVRVQCTGQRISLGTSVVVVKVIEVDEETTDEGNLYIGLPGPYTYHTFMVASYTHISHTYSSGKEINRLNICTQQKHCHLSVFANADAQASLSFICGPRILINDPLNISV